MPRFIEPRRGVIVAALAAVTSAAFTGCAASGDEPTDAPTASGGREKVQIAVFNNYPPAEFVEDGQLSGWMVDLLEPLSEESGLEFEITQIRDFSTLIPGLQSGRFEVAAANITVSAERAQIIDMVTVDSVGTGFSTPKGSDIEITSALDVCGKQVSALTGSVYIPQLQEINTQCAAAGQPKATVNLFPDSSAAVLAVANGRLDTFMGSYSEVVYSANESGQLEVEPYQFAKLPEAIGFPKDSPHTGRFLDAMNAVIESGKYAQILEKWNMVDVAIEKSELNPVVD